MHVQRQGKATNLWKKGRAYISEPLCHKEEVPVLSHTRHCCSFLQLSLLLPLLLLWPSWLCDLGQSGNELEWFAWPQHLNSNVQRASATTLCPECIRRNVTAMMMMKLLMAYAVAFRSFHLFIDTDTKQITTITGWTLQPICERVITFFFYCWGDALWKLALLRHGVPGRRQAWEHTWVLGRGKGQHVRNPPWAQGGRRPDPRT